MLSSRLASLFTLLELALVAVLALLGVLTERLLPLAALVAILIGYALASYA
jgi:hypothetical protein